MPAVSIEHYENFPVASWLCPAHLRPAVVAIYHFARTADDLADEGDIAPPVRLADLQAYRADLRAMAAADPQAAVSARWGERVFAPLGRACREHALPLPLLDALLDAFEQDLRQQRYTDRAELLAYCQRSANPVGRLLLHLYGIKDEESLRQSDAICTSLQLINFWQDASRDGPRGRCYAPDSDLARHGLSAEDWLACRDSPTARALAAELCAWARELMLSGAPLVHRIPGRAGWELRAVVQGGLLILAKIEAMNFACLSHRPALRKLDVLTIFWRALFMKAAR
ncbi:MAG TPA: squalene synthase HpnC [Burkholderiaceae bacterium]